MVDQGWLGACGFSGEFGAFWVRNLGFLGQKFGIFYDGLGVDAACGFWGEIRAFWVTNLGFRVRNLGFFVVEGGWLRPVDVRLNLGHFGSEIWDFGGQKLAFF